MIRWLWSKLTLDHRPLSSQWLFWLAIGLPVFFFLFFGCIAWKNSSLQLDHEGFNYFISISRLPLGILATAIPLVAVTSSLHKSIQTAEQIKHSEEKKREESESRIAEAAEECLKKAYELISDDDGEIVKNEILWKNSANLIAEFNNKKSRLNISEIVERLEVEEDYWRAKFENLLSSLIDAQHVKELRVDPAIIFSVAKFSVWRTGRQDASPYSTTRKEFLKTLEKLKGNLAILEYLQSHRGVLVHQTIAQVAQSVTMPHPDDLVDEAIRSGSVDDPIVVELRKQREASSKEK